MAWVVDDRVMGLRNAAVDKLRKANQQNSYAQGRTKKLEGRTRAVIGSGHADGNRIVQDAVQAISCLRRAQSAVQSAISEVKQVDTMTWEPDDE